MKYYDKDGLLDDGSLKTGFITVEEGEF